MCILDSPGGLLTLDLALIGWLRKFHKWIGPFMLFTKPRCEAFLSVHCILWCLSVPFLFHFLQNTSCCFMWLRGVTTKVGPELSPFKPGGLSLHRALHCFKKKKKGGVLSAGEPEMFSVSTPRHVSLRQRIKKKKGYLQRVMAVCSAHNRNSSLPALWIMRPNRTHKNNLRATFLRRAGAPEKITLMLNAKQQSQRWLQQTKMDSLEQKGWMPKSHRSHVEKAIQATSIRLQYSLYGIQPLKSIQPAVYLFSTA